MATAAARSRNADRVVVGVKHQQLGLHLLAQRGQAGHHVGAIAGHRVALR